MEQVSDEISARGRGVSSAGAIAAFGVSIQTSRLNAIACTLWRELQVQKWRLGFSQTAPKDRNDRRQPAYGDINVISGNIMARKALSWMAGESAQPESHYCVVVIIPTVN
jgi:hypothetical protein